MIIATSTVTNNQAVGGTTGVVQLTQTAANTTTSAYILSVKLTLGASMYDPSQKLKVWYTSSPYNVSTTGNAAATQHQYTARWMDVQLGQRNPGDIIIMDSSLEVLTGGYIYIWIEAGSYSPTVAVTITLTELG